MLLIPKTKWENWIDEHEACFTQCQLSINLHSFSSIKKFFLFNSATIWSIQSYNMRDTYFVYFYGQVAAQYGTHRFDKSLILLFRENSLKPPTMVDWICTVCACEWVNEFMCVYKVRTTFIVSTNWSDVIYIVACYMGTI